MKAIIFTLTCLPLAVSCSHSTSLSKKKYLDLKLHHQTTVLSTNHRESLCDIDDTIFLYDGSIIVGVVLNENYSGPGYPSVKYKDAKGGTRKSIAKNRIKEIVYVKQVSKSEQIHCNIDTLRQKEKRREQERTNAAGKLHLSS